MKKANGIVFAQVEDNNKVVVADKYVANVLYVRNQEIIEKLGGVIIKGVGGFRAEFPTAAKAKKFVAQAITSISTKEYNAARKSEPKEMKVSNTSTKANKKLAGNGKGNKKSAGEGNKNTFVQVVTLVDAEGNEYKVPKSALAQVEESKPTTKKSGKGNAIAPTKAHTTETKKPARKSKGDAELTEAGKKALERMQASVLNRAASAYSIANGGEATTFKALGKSAKDLSAYIPKAKAALLKSPKWAKAVELGVTEDMLK